MAKKRIDSNVMKLIKLLMHDFSKAQIKQTLDYIYKEVATVPQKQELVYDWESLLRNIKHQAQDRINKRLAKKRETEF